MDPERWRAVEDLFDRVLELPDDQRTPFLERETEDDPTLLEDVHRLLEADRQANSGTEEFIGSVIFDSTDLLEEIKEAKIRSGSFPGYELLEKIGEGGFGVVHRGQDLSLNREVAIKICTSAEERIRERFYREAQISAQLQHPNITTIFALGPADRIPPFFVQELLSGEDLSEKVERAAPLDLQTRLDYLLQIAHGLDHAHQAGVLHRDVKPGNIRVLDDGQIKILDFGIARLEEEQSPITTEGMAVGTVGYLSPEQLEGTDVDRRSDIFSFGVLAYELLVYRRPFPGTKFSEVAYKLMFEAPVPLGDLWPDCPVALEDIVLRCLKKKREDRYPNLGEVIEALEKVAEMIAPESPSHPLTRARWKARRQRLITGLVASGVAAALLAGWLLLGGEQTNEPPEPLSSSSVAEFTPPGPGVVPGSTPASEREEPPLEAPNESSSTSGSGADDPPRSAPPVSSSLGSPSPPAPRPAPTTTTPADSSFDLGARAGGEATLETSTGITRGARASRNADAPAEDGPEENIRGSAPSQGRVVSVPPALARPPDTDETSAGQSRPDEVVSLRPPPPESGSDEVPRNDEIGTETDGIDPGPVIEIPPEVLHRAEPIYPRRAERLGKEGIVVVMVLVGTRGEVLATRIRAPNPKDLGFEEAALEAARKSTFRNGTRGGTPNEQWVLVKYQFLLGR